MSVIVTDAGFAPEDWTEGFAAPGTEGAVALDIAHTVNALELRGQLEGVRMIRVAFPAFNDGRGFSIGRTLRGLGFTGRLRAAGPLLADQYAMLRRAGFDEVEIPEAMAARQPWPHWQARADWRAHDYQSRLRAG